MIVIVSVIVIAIVLVGECARPSQHPGHKLFSRTLAGVLRRLQNVPFYHVSGDDVTKRV